MNWQNVVPGGFSEEEILHRLKFFWLTLSEIIRLIDGALAPFGDAEQLRTLIDRDADHRALYQVFLEVRNAAAKILENTTLADIVSEGSGTPKSKRRAKKRSRRMTTSFLLAKLESRAKRIG